MLAAEFKILKNKYGQYALADNVNISKGCQIVKALEADRVWEADTVHFISKKINNKSMVHAGVYIGDMLPAFSSFTQGKIYAFEPNPDMTESINETIRINNLDNVIFSNKGLSDVEDTSELFYRYEDGVSISGGARIDASHQPNDRYTAEQNIKTTINTVTIDSVVKDEVSIIQLDVEGFEIHALKGAMKTIREYRPILILENVKEKNEWMLENINSLGYKKVTKLNHNNTCWEC